MTPKAVWGLRLLGLRIRPTLDIFSSPQLDLIIYLGGCAITTRPDRTYILFFLSISQFLPRAMHFSAKRGIGIACRPCVCPSVRNVGGSGPHRLEVLETNCMDN